MANSLPLGPLSRLPQLPLSEDPETRFVAPAAAGRKQARAVTKQQQEARDAQRYERELEEEAGRENEEEAAKRQRRRSSIKAAALLAGGVEAVANSNTRRQRRRSSLTGLEALGEEEDEDLAALHAHMSSEPNTRYHRECTAFVCRRFHSRSGSARFGCFILQPAK